MSRSRSRVFDDGAISGVVMRFLNCLLIFYLLPGSNLAAQEANIGRSGAVGCEKREFLADSPTDDLSEDFAKDMQRQLIKNGKCVSIEPDTKVFVDRYSGDLA